MDAKSLNLNEETPLIWGLKEVPKLSKQNGKKPINPHQAGSVWMWNHRCPNTLVKCTWNQLLSSICKPELLLHSPFVLLR